MGGVLLIRNRDEGTLNIVPATSFDPNHTEEDLHRFLEADPSMIARGIGEGEPIPTAVAASHLMLEAGELDLLLLDAEGEVTIAELKRGRTSREVVSQILDYASQVVQLGLSGLDELGVDWEQAIERLQESMEEPDELDIDRVSLNLQNPHLLLVAYETDESTRRIAEYLRSIGLQIHCVQFEYFADGSLEYYHPQVIGVGEVRPPIGRLTPAQQAYRALWEELLGRFKERRPGVTRRSTTKDSWVTLPIGLGGAHLEWAVHGLNKPNGWFEVGLHLEHSEREINLRAIEKLQEQHEKIESVLGQTVLFEEWGKRWARIYIRRDTPQIDEETRVWAVDAMVAFYEIMEQLEVVTMLRDLGW
jgi:hypothetical protein